MVETFGLLTSLAAVVVSVLAKTLTSSFLAKQKTKLILRLKANGEEITLDPGTTDEQLAKLVEALRKQEGHEPKGDATAGNPKGAWPKP